MMKGKYILCFLFCLLSISVRTTPAHDIHVTVADVKWNETSGVFEVSIKIFTDDLERTLKTVGAPDLFLGTDQELASADLFLTIYLKEHLHIHVEGKKLEPALIGKEVTEDEMAVWCYLEYPATLSRRQEITIANDVLFELFDDQRNIMNIQMSSLHRDYVLFQPGGRHWRYTY